MDFMRLWYAFLMKRIVTDASGQAIRQEPGMQMLFENQQKQEAAGGPGAG